MPVVSTVGRAHEAEPQTVEVAQFSDSDEPVYVEGIDTIARILQRARERGLAVSIASRDLAWLAKRVGASDMVAEGIPLLRFGTGRRSSIDRCATQLLGYVVASLVLLIGAPLWLLIALAVRLESSGGAFHVALRAGEGGRPFNFFKYRTMRIDPSNRAQEAARLAVIRGDIPGFLREDGTLIPKPPKDPRITRIGRLLRWSSLDEIPQLVHVLTGDMALVGPRPYPMDEFNALKSWHRMRVEGPPGVTGLWQVAARNQVTFDQSVILDIYYLANANFWLDLRIVAVTPLRMLFGVGSY